MENFPLMTSEKRRKWKFRDLNEVHQVSNAILRDILINERSKRWEKVIEAYQRLLWIIEKKNFPVDYEPPSSYAQLLYELHFHLGLACQRLGIHRESIKNYSQAIQMVSIPKAGCQAGCMTNSCLMTPPYSRRALAYAHLGELRKALRDAECAVVFDKTNPDVYCIRALVRSSRQQIKQAVQDLDYALSLSPNHVASRVVKRTITRPLSEKLNPDKQSYLNVDSFLHPCILDFYDRLLFTLLVPHTVTAINLTPDKPSKRQIEMRPELLRSISAGGHAGKRLKVFRCGRPGVPVNVLAARRRLDYGEAIRKHNATFKTGSDNMVYPQRSRTATALSVRFAPHGVGSAETPFTDHRASTGRREKTCRAFLFETPVNYSLQVFQPINLVDAPRMYYRPWQGDKLPVADVPHPQPSPPFY